MTFISTKIQGLIIFEPKIISDDRGYFFESYNKNLFQEAGINAEFVQDNQSYSKYGTIRGLHFQKGEYAQSKLVRVIKGVVLDIAVDLRSNSPTFGLHECVELSEDNNLQLFIPRGFAHGFAVLSKDAIFSYKCDNFYNKEAEGGLSFNDKDLNINWQINTDDMIISDKDKIWPTLTEYKGNPCF